MLDLTVATDGADGSACENSVRWSGVELAGAGFERECPAAFVSGVVMFRAQWDHVVHVGRTTVFPVFDVVNLTCVERDCASVERTRVVSGFERPALRC